MEGVTQEAEEEVGETVTAKGVTGPSPPTMRISRAGAGSPSTAPRDASGPCIILRIVFQL